MSKEDVLGVIPEGGRKSDQIEILTSHVVVWGPQNPRVLVNPIGSQSTT